MTTTSKGLHPRNPHNANYDFNALVKSEPQLAAFVHENKYGNLSIDFSNAQAVLLLNKALLAHFYMIKHWTVPQGYLCPPIPGRADYIHYISDLLSSSNKGIIPKGEKIKGLDIGIGANCIYPIIGNSVYEWSFVGSDVDTVSLDSAKNIISNNTNLKGKVECRLQTNTDNILTGLIKKDDRFDFTLCNPPFHKSHTEASKGTQRKNKNLKNRDTKALNFGGQANELWYPGGEISFITKMIKQSSKFSKNCLWFSSLVSKKENLDVLQKVLHNIHVSDVQIIEMAQGQKVSRIIAWTFFTKEKREAWAKENW